ncbi:hypothetical protein J4E83_004340 [Alternaria metachromatica]|uniref:uncharacterized protein n=1 Tax=Alternaria metachromatica TaxID=283354 RepID=UPI0020C5AA72|nr:uncharacterized protein J4E83_004340 [Alternaria metachromatica]KAI4624664.1 hypothetical protein J4E83_004340 [Alternaria metachromatica]
MSLKIVVSGVTGRIGAHVLHHALQNPLVSRVIAISRRPPPGIEMHAKLEVVLLEDFTKYPDDVLAKLSGADGCIWCMTTTAGDPMLELEYPKAFAEAFASTMPVDSKRFRYLHLSGGMVERDQEKSLWMKGSMRKIKGRGEVQMLEFAKMNENWRTVIARPGMVVQRGSIVGEASMMMAGSSGSFIRFDELALALVDAVVHGSEELLLPSTLVQRGQQLAREATE